ncbi:transcription factor atf1 [Coccidioides immitis RMSCC 3703]|uniref:Transcription factor atf1 n=1 Tax=Coccidioides immitis RMSCC 3703 TaxID=454286 RepID=A0A0J8R3S6_COCIT|nr:transcription factor atf1 [Coccidioides immitis RMSCC 3703]
MSAALAKRGSPRIGRPASRPDSSLDANNPLLKNSNVQDIDRKDPKPAADAAESQQPMPGPRRPGQSESETDYFSTLHNTSHFSLEPNPFDQSFGNTSAETPGKSLLPPVAALTSPSLPRNHHCWRLWLGGQADNVPYPHPGSQPGSEARGAYSRNNTPLNGGIGIARNGDVTDPQLNGDASDGAMEQSKANGRNKGKKPAAKASTAANGRRKAEDTKQGPNKKAKGANGAVDKTQEEDVKPSQGEGSTSNPKKMTDDEKRKNFLERNRVAALKCRQRKKQWLANLQAKVEMYSQENDTLSTTVTRLREEIVTLKSLLLAHKDCPVTQAQGLNASIMMNGLANSGGWAL